MLKMVLADKQAIFRAGIAKVLGVEDEIRIVAQVQSSDQISMSLEKFRPNVLAFAGNLAPNLQELIGIATRTKTRLIILAETGENGHAYVNAGVHGVVYRNVTGPALLECVRKVARGETWIQPQTLAPEEAENDMVGARVRDRLTPKELRIVALIVQGYKNKDIAAELGTTEQVIKNYLRNIYDKIGVSDRLELALFTIHHRILAEAAAATGR
ncbi:MAG: response regulator transcription factor [Acidobacteriia bacterium]|nr:response regulator transcription factor [Terriglobia bacterium]